MMFKSKRMDLKRPTTLHSVSAAPLDSYVSMGRLLNFFKASHLLYVQ